MFELFAVYLLISITCQFITKVFSNYPFETVISSILISALMHALLWIPLQVNNSFETWWRN